MKQIPKKLLDSLIYLEKLYWKTGDVEILPGSTGVAMEIQKESGVCWLSIKDFISSIFTHEGLMEDATNGKIYEALSVLGWEVVLEIEESESL